MLQNGDIDTVGYVARVGSLSKLRFQWDDLLPARGLFSVFAEYKVRKDQLNALDQEISRQRADVPDLGAANNSPVESTSPGAVGVD